MTQRQQETFRRVLRSTLGGTWYRASGSGERVTLASLFRAGALSRRAWRGNEGAPDAAHEYRVSELVLRHLREAAS